MEVIVDDRERRSGLGEALRRALGKPPEFGRMECGDIKIGDWVVVERKQIGDFAASWRDGRLADQLARLAEMQKKCRLRCIVLVEGVLSVENLPGVPLDEVRQAILSVMLDWPLVVVQSLDVEESAKWIAGVARWERGRSRAIGTEFMPSKKPVAPVMAARRNGPARGAQVLQLAALQKIPGLGPARAKALLEHFGSLGGVQCASEKEWGAVAGIGPEAVIALRRHFTRR